MNLRTTFSAAACALLMGIAPLASADSMSLNRFRNHTLPVLVTVNSQGEVTRIQPAYEVPHAIMPLLKTTLNQLITGPSIHDGKGISSQAVIQLAVEAVPQNDGKYKMHFVYVKAMPVPYGSWFWNHIDGHRLALQSDTGSTHRYHRHGMPRHFRPYVHRTAPQTASHNQPKPVQRMAPMVAPRPMPVTRPSAVRARSMR
ncbi:MAG TPA: hypothetical protein VFK31_00390 [Rhodanobacteraceae bacterium]|nr:hypothetical protein [Rhodanobacteraceae bacterium]